jgi:hypothetical protein
MTVIIGKVGTEFGRSLEREDGFFAAPGAVQHEGLRSM